MAVVAGQGDGARAGVIRDSETDNMNSKTRALRCSAMLCDHGSSGGCNASSSSVDIPSSSSSSSSSFCLLGQTTFDVYTRSEEGKVEAARM